MRKNQRVFVYIMIAVAMLFTGIAGCSTTQCNVAQNTLASAQAAYDTAVASGVQGKIDRYGWTLAAAKAVVAIWCADQVAQ